MKLLRSRRGSAYVVSLIGLVSGLVLTLVALDVSGSGSRSETMQQRKQGAASLAEAGIAFARWQMDRDRTLRPPASWSPPMQTGNVSVSVARTRSGSYCVDRILSTGQYRSASVTAQQFTAVYPYDYGLCLNNSSWFSFGREIDTASNVAMHFNHTVSFSHLSIDVAGLVESDGAIWVYLGWVTGPRETGAGKVAFPPIDLSFYEANAAVVYTNDVTLSSFEFPYEGAIVFCRKDLVLKSGYKGRGTFVAVEDIEIDTNLVPTSGSMAAMITPKRVEVDDDANTVVGILYCTNNWGSGLIKNEGSLNLYGSAAADNLDQGGSMRLYDHPLIDRRLYRTLRLPGFTD